MSGLIVTYSFQKIFPCDAMQTHQRPPLACFCLTTTISTEVATKGGQRITYPKLGECPCYQVINVNSWRKNKEKVIQVSAIDVVDSEQTGVMKLRRKQKWVSSSAGAFLILASWVALHSACHPIYIVKRGRVDYVG